MKNYVDMKNTSRVIDIIFSCYNAQYSKCLSQIDTQLNYFKKNLFIQEIHIICRCKQKTGK